MFLLRELGHEVFLWGRCWIGNVGWGGGVVDGQKLGCKEIMSEGNELGNLSASRSSFGNCDSGTGTTLSSSGAIAGL